MNHSLLGRKLVAACQFAIMIDRRSMLFLAYSFIGASCATTAYSAEPAARPNIVIILVDDMGYSDLGCMGAEIETPSLDQMANDGLLFTNCYNTSRCCPTRAALLTGQYQWDAGMGCMITTRSPFPEYSKHLNYECATIAELLGETGYSTFMSGKWHLGDAREHWPDRRGFQQFYGTPNGGGLYFFPSTFYVRPVYKNGELVTPDSDWYSTDGFTDASIEFLEGQAGSDKPFFMYLAYVAPHFPLQAKESDIAKYDGQYDDGYEAVRQARFRRQKQISLVAEGDTLPKAEYLDWDSVGDPQREARKMAVYAAQVDCLDQNIGRLLDSLDALGLVENTIVVFLSDNGASRADFDKTPDAEIGSRDCNAAYGGWYNVSNTPYRKGKQQTHEGGVITPMIVRWPNGIDRPGRRVSAPVHVMDLMPTCLSLAGAEYPSQRAGHTLDPLDGVDILPLFRDGSLPAQERLLFWEHEGNRAVRRGDWKLVSLHQRDWELYHLPTDPFEQQDLSDEKPELAEELRLLYLRLADEHGVRPWPLWRKRQPANGK